MTTKYNQYAHSAALAKARLWWDLSGDHPRMREPVSCSSCSKPNEEIREVTTYVNTDDPCWYFADMTCVCSRCGLISGYRTTIPETMLVEF